MKKQAWSPNESLVAAIFAALALLMVITGVGVMAWPLFFLKLWPHLQGMMTTFRARFLTVTVLVLTALVLYLIRRAMRFLYGLGEIGIGLALCWTALSSQQNSPLTITIALVGGVYVIVRGMDNFMVGWKEGEWNRRQ